MAAEAYSPLQRMVEVVAIAAWATLTVALAIRIATPVPSAAPLVLGLAAGFVGADFVSGVIHWIGDTWGRPDWPILGPSLIRPFREHHDDPRAIVRHDFIETNGNSSVGSLVLLGLGLALPAQGATATAAGAFLLSLSSWLFATNQIHKWAHAARVPRAVAWLQARGWILSPRHHAIHHTKPFDRYYCITTGWMNPLLERLGFFPKLERWITAVSGASPRGGGMADRPPLERGKFSS